MKTIQCPVIITGIRSKVDLSLGLTVGTPELSNEEKVAFMELQNLNCEMTLTPIDTPSDKLKVEKGLDGKSPSERLYNVIFVYYKQVNSTEDYMVFYKRHMESLIDQYKSKLEQ